MHPLWLELREASAISVSCPVVVQSILGVVACINIESNASEPDKCPCNLQRVLSPTSGTTQFLIRALWQDLEISLSVQPVQKLLRQLPIISNCCICMCNAPLVRYRDTAEIEMADNVGLQVHSSQQCAAYLVYAYPHLADTVAATNALAEVEGEPSVADIAARVAAGMPPAVCLDVPGKSSKSAAAALPLAANCTTHLLKEGAFKDGIWICLCQKFAHFGCYPVDI